MVPQTTLELRQQLGVFDDDVPALGCLVDTEFEVVSGTLSKVFTGKTTIQEFCAALKKSKELNFRHQGNPFPQLLSSAVISELSDLIGSTKYGMGPSLTFILKKIVDECKDRKEQIIDQLNGKRAQAKEEYTDDKNNADKKNVYTFIKWITSSALNTPVFIGNEARDKTLEGFITAVMNAFEDPNDASPSYFVTVGHLLDMTTEKEFFASVPQLSSASTSRRGRPIALTEAYNPLVTQPESELRFKLSLTKFQGFNPAFFKGTDDTDNPLRVAGEDDHVDFDDDIKRFEFDLHARDCKGYEEEFSSTIRALAGVLFSTISRPDVLPSSGFFNIKRDYADKFEDGEQGFLFVPRDYPSNLDSSAKFHESFRLSTVAADRYQDKVNFPQWMEKDADSDGEYRVSQASLYFWKNALSTVSHPFSIVPDGVKINDVAAVIAMSEPFAALNRDDDRNIADFREAVHNTGPLFKEGECLHLIQLTSHSIAPGLCDYVQSFEPITVHFKGAAIERGKDKKYELRYSLGTESTVIIESFMIASAIVKMLTLTTEVENPKNDKTKNVPSRLPRASSRIVSFPTTSTDKNLKHKESKRRFTAYETLYGYVTAFSPPGSYKECIDDDKYNTFLGLNAETYTNRAGFYCLGERSYHEFSSPDLPPGQYTLESSERSLVIDASAFPGKPIQEAACETYADFLAYAFYGDRKGRANRPGEHTFSTVKRTYEIKDRSKLCLPMYKDKTLVAYVTIEIKSGATITNTLNQAKPITELDAYSVYPAETKTDINYNKNDEIYYVYKDIFILSTGIFTFENPKIKSSETLTLGPLLSESCVKYSIVTRRDEPTETGDKDAYDALRANMTGILQPWKTYKGSFAVRVADIEEITNAIDASKNFVPTQPTLKYTTRFHDGIKMSEIGKMLRTGCQGYHFSRRDALSRTVFAVAINQTMKDIKAWYEDCDGTLPDGLNEPKGVHILNPDPRHKNCAKLLNFILRQEMKGTATLGRMATTGQYLITPVIVNVLGPMESNLLTPCYVDNVFSKTARFRSVEAQIIGLIESHLDMIRRIEVVKGRVRGCLAEHIMRNKPRAIKSSKWMIDKRPETIATMATLFIRYASFVPPRRCVTATDWLRRTGSTRTTRYLPRLRRVERPPL